MFYLGPFIINWVQYTQCNTILNMWTKARTWSLTTVIESETQPSMTYRRTEIHMNLNQYKGIKYDG